jgi:hypothetical protein
MKQWLGTTALGVRDGLAKGVPILLDLAICFSLNDSKVQTIKMRKWIVLQFSPKLKFLHNHSSHTQGLPGFFFSLRDLWMKKVGKEKYFTQTIRNCVRRPESIF